LEFVLNSLEKIIEEVIKAITIVTIKIFNETVFPVLSSWYYEMSDEFFYLKFLPTTLILIAYKFKHLLLFLTITTATIAVNQIYSGF